MGQEHSLVQGCKARNIDLSAQNCTIQFGPWGNVSKYGTIEPGGFEGNPGVAGEGVFWAFTVPTIVVSALGFLLVVSRGNLPINYLRRRWRKDKTSVNEEIRKIEKWSGFLHALSDDLMLSAADAQLILILAYGIAFYSIWKCQIALYHFLVAVHIVLSGLATSALSYSLTRKFYEAPLMLIVRFSLFWTGFYGLQTTTTGNSSSTDFTRMQKIPSANQTDSVILLPAYCLLDPSLDPLRNLSSTQQAYLAPQGSAAIIAVQLVCIGTVAGLAFTFAILYNGFYLWHRMLHGRIYRVRLWSQVTLCKILFKLGAWDVCFAFAMWNLFTINALRNWINASIWLQRDDGVNPEHVIQGLGQVAPLVALINILFGPIGAVSGKLRSWYFPSKDDGGGYKRRAARRSSVEFQPLNSHGND